MWLIFIVFICNHMELIIAELVVYASQGITGDVLTFLCIARLIQTSKIWINVTANAYY